MADILETLSHRITPVVGYEPDGARITQQDLMREIEEAEAQFERGEYITTEELEKETQNG